MSKMSNEALNKVDHVDSYLEHSAFHQEYHNDCSTCHSEGKVLRAFRTVNTNRLREELGLDNDSALRGGLFGRGTPWDKGRE